MLNLDRIIGLIAPNICLGCGVEGAVLCNHCLLSAGQPPSSRCAGCRTITKDYRTCGSCRGWLNVYAVFVATSYEGVYEQLIHTLKFDMKRQSAQSLVSIMIEYPPKLAESIIICPIPTASSRIRQRGFDHARFLAKGYKDKLPKTSPWQEWRLKYLLGRKTNVRQLGSSRSQRINQMEEEFYTKGNADVKGRTILLIDDVMTTGASLSAAAKTLKDAGAKRVYAAVFAQTL